MIKETEIYNFKSIQELKMECSNLNLLIGINSAGKSTICQALLLLGQNITEQSGLNGSLIKLGTLEENCCRYLANREICVCVKTDQGESVKEMIQLNRETKLWDIKTEYSQSGREVFESLFDYRRRNLQYLSCHRIGPQNLYEENMDINEQLGTDGRYAISFLNKHGDNLMEQDMCRGNADFTLLGQVNWWLNYITQTQISTEPIAGADAVRAYYKMNEVPNIRPANVGSGISYLISILVMCMASTKGSILIIENPEIHLHPSAQAKVCELLYFLSQKERQIFVETHSDHIFNGFRAGIATKEMDAEKINVQFIYMNDENATEAMRVAIGKYGTVENQRENLFDQFDLDLNKMIGL